MAINDHAVIALLLVFVRISACLFSSPIFGQQTPVQIRILLCASLSFALTPVLQATIHRPDSLPELAMMVLYEVVVGLLLGTCIQLLAQAAQIGGSIIDLQGGFGSAMMFNPMAGTPVSLIANFKYWLALILLLLFNGHHLMLNALVHSYALAPGFGQGALSASPGTLLEWISKTSLLALQIAAPPAGVALLVDIAAGVVNKSVPQMQVFLVAMPGKILMTLLAVGLALPVMVSGVNAGLEHCAEMMSRMVGGH